MREEAEARRRRVRRRVGRRVRRERRRGDDGDDGRERILRQSSRRGDAAIGDGTRVLRVVWRERIDAWARWTRREPPTLVSAYESETCKRTHWAKSGELAISMFSGEYLERLGASLSHLEAIYKATTTAS